MRKLHLLLFGALFGGGLVACSKQDSIGPTDDEILQADKADILAYANSKNLGGSITSNGVYYAVTTPASASGVAPTNGLEAEFNYKLYQLTRSSGASTITEIFVDSSFATKSSYVYVVAANAGLTEALLKMREGEQGVALLPSLYAFGRSGSGSIGPNTPIRLDMKLKRVRTEDQQIDEYLTTNKLTPTEVTNSGLRFVRTLTNANGVTPTPTQTLTLRYRGQLLRSPTAFDSTGTGTYSAVASTFIPGFAEGISKLRVGEKATLLFPSKIGYKDTGYQVIPGYAPLRFDVELVSVQ